MKKFIFMQCIILAMLLPACANATAQNKNSNKETEMKITFNNHSYIVKLVDNSSTRALIELLEKGPITVEMEDYGNFEKVGPLPQNLPRNDQQITTTAGDIILYQGRQFVIYYDTNSWNFTRLGKIENVTSAELKTALGSGSVIVTLLLE